MKYIIVTQTYPPRIGGMQNVMTSISKRLSSIEYTHVFPDHYLSKKKLLPFTIVKERFYEIGSFKGISDFKKYLKK